VRTAFRRQSDEIQAIVQAAVIQIPLNLHSSESRNFNKPAKKERKKERTPKQKHKQKQNKIKSSLKRSLNKDTPKRVPRKTQNGRDTD
jgi:hypothetical protein